MKFFAHVRFSLWLALLLAFGAVRAEAGNLLSRGGFNLTVANSTNLYFVGNLVTTTITVSNGTGLYLNNVYVTNTFSATVLYTSFTNFFTATNTFTTNGNTLNVIFSPMTNNQVAQASFNWIPLFAGPLLNTTFVYSDTVTNTATAVNLSRVYSATADLGAGLALVTPFYVTNDFWVITNDWVTYQVTVTNAGPGSASGVLVTNFLPTGVTLVPPASTTTSNELIYSVGNLAGGAAASYQFTLQATNPGSFVLNAQVGAPTVYDPNGPNNQTNLVLFATNYLAMLKPGTNTVQTVNLQNGLQEQVVRVTNNLVADEPAVRLVVTGLPSQIQLFNASGTNGGQPFVVYPDILAANRYVGLRLQYYGPRQPFILTNGQLHAYAVPASVLQYTPPPVQSTTNVGYYRMQQLANGDMLLEFTNLGSSYTVVYSDNALFLNARIATPVVRSEANRIQWLDYGPPETISAPTNASARYYKVLLNP